MSMVAIAVGLGVISTGASIANGVQANKLATEAMNQQADANNKALQTEQNTMAKNSANAARDAQSATSQTNAAQKQGRSGTVLTSPLGVGNVNSPSNQPAANNQKPGSSGGFKTILGA